MSITITLPVELETTLKERVATAGGSVDAFVRDAVQEKLEREARPPRKLTPFEAGREVFGRHSSGRSDLSENADAIVSEIIRGKRRR